MERIEKLSFPRKILLVLALLLLNGVVDQVTGFELSFSLFYLAPVAVAAWYLPPGYGLFVACLSAVVWVVADITSGHIYSTRFFFFWNGLIRLGIFVIVATVLTRLRQALDVERRLARTDYLTGAFNSRYFHEIGVAEILRSRRYRHPLSLAYIDLDNFKQMNDRHGHAAGDQLLQKVTRLMMESVRSSDRVARIGGDEFVILLPETNSAAAQAVLQRVSTLLRHGLRDWGGVVTCSIGVASCDNEIPEIDGLIRLADSAMYEAKSSGKDKVAFVTHDGGGNASVSQ